MYRLFAIISAMVFSTVLSSCTKNSCERYCDCRGTWDPEVTFEITGWGNENAAGKSCVELCEHDVKGGVPPCRKAFREYSHCIEDNSCNSAHCENEAGDVMLDCLVSSAL